MMAMLTGRATWFAVLPDCPAAGAVARRLSLDTVQVIRHPSGRPWIIGCWTADELATAVSGRSAMVVAGQHPATTRSLAAQAARIRDVSDLDRAGAEMPGSYHLAASAGGKVRIQGRVSGLRRIFFTRTAGVTVAADSPGILARLTAARPDPARLALELLYPRLPGFLDATSLWPGVQALPPDRYLLIDAAGDSRTIRWWRPPEPELPLAEGAPAFGDALRAAVDLRTRGSGTISCDLSGGLDSTSLCFLAARGGKRVISVTMRGLDPVHDDAVWADRAAGHLDGIERLVLEPGELPPRYARLEELCAGLDDPAEIARDFAVFSHVGSLVTRRGSRMHLAGHGGDHLLNFYPAYVHSTFRTCPGAAPGYLRASRAQFRWPLLPALREIADQRGYAGWLTAEAAAMTTSAPLRVRGRPGFLGWENGLGLPPWMSAEAADAVRSALVQQAAAAEPLAPYRGQHALLAAVRECARTLRPLAQLTASDGLALAVPYLDDRVVEAALRVRMHERATPRHYKPLLTRAMDGTVPAEVLARKTKGEFGAEATAGLRQHRSGLAALFDDPLLGRLGLIDAAKARGAVLGRYPTLPPSALQRTLACEVWLRVHDDAVLEPAGGAV
jgi:asparagine synthase (glutamine-hydrolysing)